VRRPLRPRPSVAAYQQGARARLRRFRQGSTLAVALTALLLFLGGVPGETAGDSQPEVPVDAVAADPAVALEQAGGTLRELVLGFYAYLPKLAVALILLGFAWVIARIARSTLRRTLGQWERADAVSALATIAIYLGATVIAMSILAGDARALLGSVGLIRRGEPSLILPGSQALRNCSLGGDRALAGDARLRGMHPEAAARYPAGRPPDGGFRT
jgi:hypothetical protein